MAAAPAIGLASNRPVLGADLALVNGKIITLNPAQPMAEAVLVKGGIISAVGTTAAILEQARGLDLFDARGRTVIPGFVDNHCHIEQTCVTAELEFDLATLPSIAAMLDHIAAVAATRLPGEWLVFQGSGFPGRFAEQRWLTRQDLDRAAPDNPVMVILVWHASILNSLGWRKIGYWDPASAAQVKWSDGSPRLGSFVHRDSAGQPTGVGTELWDFRPHYPVAAYVAAIGKHFSDWFLSKGLTSITTLPTAQPEQWGALKLVQSSGKLPARVRVNLTVPHSTTLDEVERMGIRSGSGTPMMRFGGIKLFVDDGLDGMGNPRSDMKWTGDRLAATLTRCNRLGLAAILHVVTDEGWAMAIGAIEAAERSAPARYPHRVDHYSPVADADISRARAARIGFGLTPLRQDPETPRRAGRYAFPHRYRTLLKQGIPISLVLDVARTGGDYHPMRGIANVIGALGHGGTTTAGETLDLETALRLWTHAAAAQNGEGDVKGVVARGCYGDFAVLSRDPRGLHPHDVFGITTEATICGGQVTFGA